MSKMAKILPLIVLMLVCVCKVVAQTKDSKAKKYYKKAYYYYSFSDYEKSIEYANKALYKDSLHVNTLVLFTDIYNLQRKYSAELKIYKVLLRIDSTDVRSHINTADIYLKTGQFEKAFKQYSYLKKAHWLPERYDAIVLKNYTKSEKGLEIVNNPKPFNRKILSGQVNSELDEYWPYITPDGRKLFFTQTNFSKKEGEKELRREENIYNTSWHENDSSWQQFYKLPPYINTIENEGAQCITQDGKTMFFTVCKTTLGNQGDCNIYFTQWRKQKWTSPTKLPTPINTPFKETQPSISYDGKMLFFSSDRPGGKGGMDIWVSQMNSDSVWATPLNLGFGVNTSSNEESPFIHPDNHTLYFSSTGHYGLGNGDFFMAKLNNKSQPINLGFPLNNHEMQLGIYVDLEGKFGYYASVDPERNTGLDIYRFTLPIDVQPDKLKIINGKLIDAITNKPIKDGDIEVYKIAKNQHVVSYTTQNEGFFKFGLPANTQFAILAGAEGYLPYSMHSDVNDLPNDSILEIALFPLFVEGTFVLKNIFFDFDSDSLKNTSFSEIQYLANFINKHPQLVIEIGGHTDNFGTDIYNNSLSERRAKAVFKALEKTLGKDLSEKVQIRGYGASKPVANNETETGRQLNRRTEVKILQVN